MGIDKINDEFIVDCTNNSKEERQQVYKFLVDNRHYSRAYLTHNYPIIVCNKKEMNSNHYNTVDTQKAFPNYPIYTFEQFKKMYVNANNMKIYTIKELRNAPIKIKIYSEEQAIKLAYAVGYDWDWKPSQAKYPIYCYLSNHTCPSWNYLESDNKNKSIIIEFNQIENFMENKKIIGYKLIKPEYTKAVCAIEGYICFGENIRDGHVIFLENREEGFKKLQDAKVLDLWFEAMYEKEFKVGDWVLTSEKANGWGSSPAEINNKILKIKKIDKSERLEYGGKYYFDNLRTIGQEILRKATEEEIEKAKSEIVKMFSSNKGEFEIEVKDGKAYYRPENKHLPKEWIKVIINSYGNILIQKNVINPYNVEISSINVGCYHNCKKEDWENVYKLLK